MSSTPFRHRLPRTWASTLIFNGLSAYELKFVFGVGLATCRSNGAYMFKLSTVETSAQRRLVLEGKLVLPWTEDVESAWRHAQEDLEGRELVVDLTNLTLIGPD